MDLLRFATAGSVDDGKSTLIGRLLYDTKSIFEDQWAAVERASEKNGAAMRDRTGPARRTGSRAEREQGITIDVAYRYSPRPAEIHSRRLPRAFPIHPQHGHRRLVGATGPVCWLTSARA